MKINNLNQYQRVIQRSKEPKSMLQNRIVLSSRAIGALVRGYSTISTQATVGHQVHVQTPISTTIKPPSIEPVNIQDQHTNLLKAKQLFQDNDGVFSKIGILEDVWNKGLKAKIRIGLLGPKPSFLNTLLSDPFASDQTWYQSLLTRSQDPLVIKYTDQLEITDDYFGIPSPILQAKSIEFIEFSGVKQDYNDGCHLYLNFDERVHKKWPTFDLQDVSVEEPSSNEINSELAFQATNLLIESPLNASEYTSLYNQSNFTKFGTKLDDLIDPENVTKSLYKSIIKNFQSQNISNSYSLAELESQNNKIQNFIKSWDESTHREFQLKFKPYITEFELKNLSWWKLYYKNDDVETILTQMLQHDFLNDSMKQYSYIKGQIDCFSSLKTETKFQLEPIDENALSALRTKIIDEDLVPIQNQVIKLLTLNFIGLQLPLGLVAGLGWWFYGFEPYSMISLASLGLVLGFNNISKEWMKIIINFKKQLFEQVRIAIGQTQSQLIHQWDEKYDVEKSKILERVELLQKLDT